MIATFSEKLHYQTKRCGSRFEVNTYEKNEESVFVKRVCRDAAETFNN